MFRGVALQFFIAVGVNVDTARLKGTLGENNLVGGGGYLHWGSAWSLGKEFLAALYNTIQLGGGGGGGVGGRGLSTEVQLGPGYFCRAVYHVLLDDLT